MRDPKDIHNEWLVLRCQDGDPSALTELVDLWQLPLLRQAARLTGSADAAHEVAQDVWMAIVRGLPRLNDPARFRGWAYRIVANKSADWIRRKQRSPRQSLESEPYQQPASRADRDETTDRVKAALLKLSVERRQLLALFYSDDMSIQEIATVLELPVGTVKSRLHHARNELKELLERDEQ